LGINDLIWVSHGLGYQWCWCESHVVVVSYEWVMPTMEGHQRENDDGLSSRDDGQTLREKDDGQTSKRDRRGTDIEERKTMGLVFLFCLFVYLLVCLSVCQKRYLSVYLSVRNDTSRIYMYIHIENVYVFIL